VNWDSEKESVLVKAARQGDRAAFRKLYDHYLPLIYARVCALVPLTDAEDVTQEVFLSVARSIHGFCSRSALSTWMNSIVGRRVADYYRRAARQVPQVPLADDCDVPAEDNPGSLAGSYWPFSEGRRLSARLPCLAGDRVARAGIQLSSAEMAALKRMEPDDLKEWMADLDERISKSGLTW
jgi:RNA polymerase sigma factor (sigma-70 family)